MCPTLPIHAQFIVAFRKRQSKKYKCFILLLRCEDWQGRSLGLALRLGRLHSKTVKRLCNEDLA